MESKSLKEKLNSPYLKLQKAKFSRNLEIKEKKRESQKLFDSQIRHVETSISTNCEKKLSPKFVSKHFELILYQRINNSFKLDLKIIIKRLYFEIIISKQV